MRTSSIQHPASKVFCGPIFLVGLPRSGTKLLREMLNRHSRIAIAANESYCLPYFHRRFARYGDIRRPANFARFYADFSRSAFFRRLSARAPFISREIWQAQVQAWDFPGVIAAFYQSYAKYYQKDIWGDKTPGYLREMPLLKSLYPEAKFIHIIRDVRDYGLSIRRAWQKNIFRAAQRWHDDIRRARRDAAAHLGGDYLEVRYEQLLDTPEAVLRRIAEFLQFPFETAMLTPPASTENLGDARAVEGILRQNYGKWKTALTPAEIAKIERICGALLEELGYPVRYRGQPQRLHPLRMRLYQAADGWRWLLFQLRQERMQGVLNFFRSGRYRQKAE